MMARSNLSAILRGPSSGANPSFSINSTAPKFPLGPDDLNLGLPDAGRGDRRIMEACEITAHLQRADPEAVPGMRFVEMPARVVDDIPCDAGLHHVVGQQGLGEIIGIQLLAGHLLDVAAGGIHDLAGIGGQRAVAAHLVVGLPA